MNTYQNSKYTVMQNGAKFLGIPVGIFLDVFPGIHIRELTVALTSMPLCKNSGL